jgi:hypothetical protein
MMRVIAEHQRDVPIAFGTLNPRATLVPIDFSIVCLWCTLGLLMTALAFTLGFGAEVGQALAAAG